jgi:uncharacterized membrane protein YfcA
VFSLLFLVLARRGRWLDFGIGCVFALIALRMIVDAASRPSANHGQSATTSSGITGSKARMILLGGVAGILPGLFGIGTGAVLVPGFAYLLKAPIKIAIGSALACFCANALISAVMKYMQGYVHLGLALPVCLGCLAGAQLGAVVNNRMPSGMVTLMFGLVFAWVAFRFVASGLGGTP